MDNLGFQAVPRFPLTPAEEALLPRPHASASQVATALPSTYIRNGSNSQLSLPSQGQQHRLQYSRKNQQNYPYSTNQGPRIFPFSFSSSSIINRNQQSTPPSSPTTPSHNGPTFNNSETDEREYPQNPQDGCHDYDPHLHSPIPHWPSSPELQPPHRPFSNSPRPSRTSSPQLYSDLHENTSSQRQCSSPYPPHRTSLDSHPRLTSPLQIVQGYHESWESAVRVESPVPLSDSESSQSDTKSTPHSDEPRRLGRKDMSSRSQRSPVTPNTANNSAPQHRTSLDSEYVTRFSYDSQREVLTKTTRSGNNLHDLSDEERQEPRKTRPAWRPSLSLIRQESSAFNVLTLQDQRQYPQNDQRRISDTPAPNEPSKSKPNRHTRKKRKGSRKRPRQRSQFESYTEGGKTLPSLHEVLEKKSRYPLSYDDFEAFLKSQCAVEYLNFWADVTAHEQLCRTFNVSERRLKREYQLEERALARDRRRLARPTEYEMARTSQSPDRFLQEQGSLHNRTGTSEQGVKNSIFYRTSRSSLQLPLNDHLSFPQESHRYGIQESPRSYSPAPYLTSQLQGSEQRIAGAYNRLLIGTGARKSSLDASQQSFDVTSLDNDATLTDIPPTVSQIQGSGSIGGPRFHGRKSSIAVDYLGNGMKPSGSQLTLSLQRHDQNTRGDVAHPVEAVGRYTDSPLSNRMSQQSLKIVEPIIHKKPSVVKFDDAVDPSQFLPTTRRSSEGTFSPTPYSVVHDGRPLLAQSYRTISMEDVEESALRIYRKYLIQLRSSSMRKEEEEAAVGPMAATLVGMGVPNTTANPSTVAPDWEVNGEQVIAEWNEKWRGRSLEVRRAKRMSNRRDTLNNRPYIHDKEDVSEKDTPQPATNTAEIDNTNIMGVDLNEKPPLSEDGEDMTVEGPIPGQRKRSHSGAPHRPKANRDSTVTGITSFIARLLRTETTVLELPTLTINTTTVVTDVDSGSSEYDDDDDDYDSDDMEFDEDEEILDGNRRLEAPKMTFEKRTEPTSVDNTMRGSIIGDPAPSETGTNSSAIQLQHIVPRQPIGERSEIGNQVHGAQLQEKSRNLASVGISSLIPPPILSPGEVAQSREAGAFYLPLDCRERIHVKIQQENRIDGVHVFGPAKRFVMDVVLQGHYFPLFLKQIKNQNLGLLHSSHVNNRIKQDGMIVIGVALWVAVIAVQVTLIMMAWGGWTRPWVWVVGVAGGCPGTICLATGITGFSPILGIAHKM
ncbi:hypothetical protein BGX21_011328 [Mortierella sp. AD011]|nr:hypothetical protein BGX20_000711 [Mortierella sp. AD010]KAF9391061.1 hypothetical protein BGX21_011328 [Mortierella sp. AD011]